MRPKDLSLPCPALLQIYSAEIHFTKNLLRGGAFSQGGSVFIFLAFTSCFEYIFRNSNISKDTNWCIQSIYDKITPLFSAVKSNFSSFYIFCISTKDLFQFDSYIGNMLKSEKPFPFMRKRYWRRSYRPILLLYLKVSSIWSKYEIFLLSFI